MSTEDYDWIFDYVLQFLESDEFDSLIMDFVDEKCDVFDNNEENKFIYTDIHKEFSDYIDLLISSNLSEVGITLDKFIEACEKSRNTRDINQLVFERLIAIDDFVTFKRMMVKRNIELQIEALESYHKYKSSLKYSKLSDNSIDVDEDDDEMDEEITRAIKESLLTSERLPDPDEIKAVKESELEDLKQREELLEDEMQEILHSSLMEMEILHRREELEQADLEAALAMSLALEQERIRLIREEVKNQPIDKEDYTINDEPNYAEAKEQRNSLQSSKDIDIKSIKDIDNNDYSSNNKPLKIKPINNNSNLLNIPDPKPLKFRNEYKPLPGINQLNEELKDRMKLTEETIQLNQKQLNQQKLIQENMKNQLNISEEDIEKRAKYMSEQRDKIILQKKLEREKKLKKKLIEKNENENENEKSLKNDSFDHKIEKDEKSIDDQITNEKRSLMRLALAKKLKYDLINDEENKLKQLYDNQFIEFDKQLKQVELTRTTNQQRDQILAEQLRKQQITMAKNIQISATKLKDNI